MMRLLSRYVAWTFVRYFVLGLGLCTALYVVIELSDCIDNFIERQAYWRDAVSYMLLKLPGMLYYLVPVAYLLASVLTFSALSKHNEVVAMRAAGVSLLQLSRPVIYLGLVGCAGLLLAQEYLLPYTNQLEGQVWRTRIQEQKRDARLGGFKQGALWYRADNRIWSVQQGEPLSNQLLGVTIYVMDSTGGIHERYDAALASWDKTGWTLHDGGYRRFNAQGDFADVPVHFQQRHVSFAETPREISALEKAPNERSIRESLTYARQLRQQGLADTYYMVEFHSKLAFSAVCIIMAGFGAPLALVSNRSGGAARAVALTLVCGFSYWIVNSLALAFGYNDQLPPVLAAWLGNICFGMGSLYLAVRAH